MSENSSKIPRKIIAHEFFKSSFQSFITFRSFPRILFNVRFQFCSAAESVLSRPMMISQSICKKAGQGEQPFNNYKHSDFLSENRFSNVSFVKISEGAERWPHFCCWMSHTPEEASFSIEFFVFPP